MKDLLENLDEHSKSIQPFQPTRKRNYDESYCHNVTPPEDLPSWAYKSEDEEEQEIKQSKKGKQSAEKHKKRRVSDYEESLMYSEGEEHQTGESAHMGEIRGAILKEKTKEKAQEWEVQKPQKTTPKQKKFGTIKSLRVTRAMSKSAKEKEDYEKEDLDEMEDKISE